MTREPPAVVGDTVRRRYALSRHELDDRLANAVVITECSSFLLVHGLELIERSAQSDYAAFDAVLEAHDVTGLLDAAFRRRTAQAAQPAGRSVLQSLGLQRRS